MSLTYLYNKLENMNSEEQYCYIQNIFKQLNIIPKIGIDEILKNIPGKESSGKNPLGYIVMNLDVEQLQRLIPEYLRALLDTDDTFSDTYDRMIIDIVKSAVDCIEYKDNYFYFPYRPDISDRLEVFKFGLGKYHEWSFLKLNPYTLVPALFRHLYKYFYKSKLDEETGISHLAHAACNKRMIELILERGIVTKHCNEDCDNCSEIGCKRFGELNHGT